MNRSVKTILGLAVVAGAAIFLGRAYLKPASERAQASEKVLSGAYDARIEMCRFLEDNELPEEIPPPEVGSDTRYLRVLVLFPEVTIIAGAADEYHLGHVNGDPGRRLEPLVSEKAKEDDGVILTLTFETDDSFLDAKLVRGKKVVVGRVELE